MRALNVSIRLDEALSEELEDIRQHPTAPNWDLCRRNQSWVVAEIMTMTGDHASADRAAAELALEGGLQWQAYYDAACLTACCVRLANADEKLSPEDRAKLARYYAARAVLYLKSAIRLGLPESTRILQDSDFDPIRDHRGFAMLAARLRKHVATNCPANSQKQP